MRQEKLNGRPPKEQHKKRSYQVNVKLMTEEYYYLKSQASKAAMPIMTMFVVLSEVRR